MKKETKEWILSWCYVGYFAFLILSTIRIYLVYGWGIDLQFTLAIGIPCGVFMGYIVLKTIKNKEFYLKKPGVVV